MTTPSAPAFDATSAVTAALDAAREAAKAAAAIDPKDSISRANAMATAATLSANAAATALAARPVPKDKWQIVTRVGAAIGGVAAFWLAYFVNYPLDRDLKEIQKRSNDLDIAVKQSDSELRKLESTHKLNLEIYQEVQKVLRAAKKNEREEEAVRVIVQALTEDPLRAKLLDAISLGAQSNDVRKKAKDSAEFYRDELVSTTGQQPYDSSSKGKFASINVDIFYCASSDSRLESLAKQAITVKDNASTGRWRIRLLPESINSQAGYGISTNVIRYNADEKSIAEKLAASLKNTLKIDIATQQIAFPTPNYVSVFFCSHP